MPDILWYSVSNVILIIKYTNWNCKVRLRDKKLEDFLMIS